MPKSIDYLYGQKKKKNAGVSCILML